MPTFPVPICTRCKHFKDDDRPGLRCDVFPGGIPDLIIRSAHDHRQPFKGDNNVVFEPVDKDAEQYAHALFSLLKMVEE